MVTHTGKFTGKGDNPSQEREMMRLREDLKFNQSLLGGSESGLDAAFVDLKRKQNLTDYADICSEAYAGCEGAKNPSMFDEYCEKGDSSKCPYSISNNVPEKNLSIGSRRVIF